MKDTASIVREILNNPGETPAMIYNIAECAPGRKSSAGLVADTLRCIAALQLMDKRFVEEVLRQEAAQGRQA